MDLVDDCFFLPLFWMEGEGIFHNRQTGSCEFVGIGAIIFIHWIVNMGIASWVACMQCGESSASEIFVFKRPQRTVGVLADRIWPDPIPGFADLSNPNRRSAQPQIRDPQSVKSDQSGSLYWYICSLVFLHSQFYSVQSLRNHHVYANSKELS